MTDHDGEPAGFAWTAGIIAAACVCIVLWVGVVWAIRLLI